MANATLTALAALLLALPTRAEYRAFADRQTPAHLEGGGSLAITETGIELIPAWRPSPDSRDEYGLGAGFQYTFLDLADSALPDFRLYAFRIPFQASLSTASRVRILARLTPSVNTDLKDVDDQDLRLGGVFLAMYPWKPRLQVGAGVALTDSTGFYGLLPAAGLRWQATDRLDLDLFLPRPRLRYACSDAWSIFISGSPAGGQWNIGQGTPEDPQRDLHVNGIQVAAGAAWRPRPGVELSLATGGVFARSLDIDGPRQTEFRQSLDVDDASFIALALQVAKPGRPSR